MEGFEGVLAAVLVSVACLNALASRIGIPYPIVLVLGGLAIGLVPSMPDIELDPDLVLLVFLPPLLYYAAFFTDLRELRSYARALTLTSIGLVLATTALVAVVGHAVFDLPWPMALALGAIVSPTDPVAATSIMRRLGAPRRIVNLVEGESPVNDAAALVTYRVAVTAAVAGRFTLAEASLEFGVSVAGGIALGLAVGWVIGEIRRRLDLAGRSVAEVAAEGPLVVETVVGARFAWVFTTPYLIRAIDRRPRQRELRVGAAARVVVAWSGMRGVVSLATALALPLATDAGGPCPTTTATRTSPGCGSWSSAASTPPSAGRSSGSATPGTSATSSCTASSGSSTWRSPTWRGDRPNWNRARSGQTPISG